MIRNFVFVIFSCLLCFNFSYAQDNNKSVFYSNRGAQKKWLAYQDNHRALYSVICNEAFNQLESRSEKIAELDTGSDWEHYRMEAKNKLCGSLSKFSKTALNARTTGTLERETFFVEKILFESHPGFYVTGCLFLPKVRENPAPAVIYCSGHTELGFRSETYQRVIINLVNKGFIVFAFDPIGQGERLQYTDPDTGESKVGGATTEHSYAGVQTLLAGSSLSDYFIWDGVRALDYLETRQEIDMARIGITGRSGGGTQSAMIAACDERIHASAPECYITSFKRLLQSIGPQDAEQNPYHAIQKGFDHPDFLHARAPKPTLIVTTTHDFFSIQGARETYSEAQKSFQALGKPDNIQFVEDLGGHESTVNNREAVYSFFQKHLDLPGDKSDKDVPVFSVEELWVTQTGQVGTSLKGETVYTLNKRYFPGKEIPGEGLVKTIKKIAGIDFSRQLTAAVYTGRFSEEDFTVEKYFLENNREDFALPVYVIQKENQKPKKTMVWLHPDGKEKILKEPLLYELLNDGNVIVSCDLPGKGELYDAGFSGDGFVRGVPFNYTFGANLAGKSIAGIQAEAIDLLMQFVENKQWPYHGNKTDALIQGTANAAFLHFSAFKNSFRKIVLLNNPNANLDIIQREYYNPEDAFYAVPGSLLFYDYSELISLLPEKNFKMFQQKMKQQNGLPKKNHADIVRFFRQ